MKRRGRTRRISVAAAVVVLVLLAFGWLIAPNDPDAQHIAMRLKGASSLYPMGTDALGRCVLSRLMYGGRTTLFVVLTGLFLTFAFGTAMGLIHGAAGGRLRGALDVVTNLFTAFPPMLYAILMAGAWGGGAAVMIAAIFLSTWALLSRLIRTRTEEELGRAYALCAVTAGAGRARLLARHILPNILGDALGFLTLTGADMVMLMTGLSFVGIGMGTDIIDWGAMIADGRAGMMQNPLLVWAPAAGIFLMTFSLYALGERIGPGRDL